jgi:hypothetical protein
LQVVVVEAEAQILLIHVAVAVEELADYAQL